MNFRKLIGVILFLVTSVSLLSAMGNKVEVKPAGMKKFDIKNMEYEKFVTYVGDAVKNYSYEVYKISSDGKIMDQYLDTYNVSGPFTNLPSKLDNFANHFVIDLENFTLLRAVENSSNRNFAENRHGTFYEEYNFDYANQKVDYIAMSWNGNEIKTQKSRMKLNKGFSYSIGNTIPTFLRMLDPTRPGIFYFAMPQFLKDPLPVFAKVIAKEEITTPIKKFQTVKIRWGVTDTFLSSLYKNYSDSIYIWIDSETARWVKYVDASQGLRTELIETGIWADK